MKYMHRKGIKTSLGDRKIGLMPDIFCVHTRLVYIYNTSHKTAAQSLADLSYSARAIFPGSYFCGNYSMTNTDVCMRYSDC